MRYKTIFDCATNTQAAVPFSPEEEMQRDADEAAAVAAAALVTQYDAAIAALRQQIITIAQSAVGVRVDQLTAAQMRALAAVLFQKAGAVAADLTIRPLADWA